MAIVTMNSQSAELTPQEIKELEELENKPIVFDEDCPEMTKEKLRQFHAMDSVNIKVSPNNMKKIKELGENSQIIACKGSENYERENEKNYGYVSSV